MLGINLHLNTFWHNMWYLICLHPWVMKISDLVECFWYEMLWSQTNYINQGITELSNTLIQHNLLCTKWKIQDISGWKHECSGHWHPSAYYEKVFQLHNHKYDFMMLCLLPLPASQSPFIGNGDEIHMKKHPSITPKIHLGFSDDFEMLFHFGMGWGRNERRWWGKLIEGMIEWWFLDRKSIGR